MPSRNVSAKRTDVLIVNGHRWIDRERPGFAARPGALRAHWNGSGRVPHWGSELRNRLVNGEG
jgi:hypothetical protein